MNLENLNVEELSIEESMEVTGGRRLDYIFCLRYTDKYIEMYEGFYGTLP